MISWETVISEKFCNSVRDGTHDTPKETSIGKRLVTSKHIKNGQILSEDGYFISEQDYERINQRSFVEQWDVLMSMIGTVGEAAVVKTQPDFAIKNVALFKCGDEMKAKWLYYFLCSPNGKGQLYGNQKGSSQQFVSLTQLRNLPIPVTDPSYMNEVVAILSAYDDLIENNQKQIKLLEEAARRLYKEWFVDLHFPGHEATKIVDGVPEGWKGKKLSDIITVKYGKDHKKIPEGEVPVYGSGGLMRYCSKALFSGESVLIPRKGSLNNIMYVNESFWTVDTMFYSEQKVPNSMIFVYGFLKNLDLYSMNTGAAVPSTTTETLNNLSVLQPTSGVLQRYDDIARDFYGKIFTLTNQVTTLQQARDKLLPKLMNGEIKV